MALLNSFEFLHFIIILNLYLLLILYTAAWLGPIILRGISPYLSFTILINSFWNVFAHLRVIPWFSPEKPTRIFATERGYGEFKGGWEFPGGKIEPGETPEAAIIREIKEELETEIKVGELIQTIEYDYPTFHLSMDCFWCEIIKGNLVLKEAEDAKWLTKEQLYDIQCLPADVRLISIIEECF